MANSQHVASFNNLKETSLSGDVTTYCIFEISEDFDGLFQMFYCPVPSSKFEPNMAKQNFEVRNDGDNCFLMKFSYPGKINTSARWRGEDIIARPYSELMKSGGLFQVDRVWPGQIVSKEKLNSVGVPWENPGRVDMRLPECAIAYFSNPLIETTAKIPSRNDLFLTSLIGLREIYEYNTMILSRDKNTFMKAI